MKLKVLLLLSIVFFSLQLRTHNTNPNDTFYLDVYKQEIDKTRYSELKLTGMFKNISFNIEGDTHYKITDKYSFGKISRENTNYLINCF